MSAEMLEEMLKLPAYKSPKNHFVGDIVNHVNKVTHGQMVEEFQSVTENATSISLDHTFKVG
jgi:hypothetical protein